MIEFALAAHLLSRPSVNNIVNGRIYAERAPQKETRPRIVYSLTGGAERFYHSTGASGLIEATVTLLLHSTEYSKARELYEAIRNEIDGFKGTWGSTVIDRAVLSPAISASNPPSQGDDTGQPAVRCSVDVFYYEAIPSLGAE